MSEDIGGEGHGQAPIIIKRKHSAERGHHGGAWKVAYADMVTTLMALFIVLWILAQSDDFKAQVAGYFQDPASFSQGGGASSPLDGSPQSSVLEEVAPKAPSSPRDDDQMWRDRAREIRQALQKRPSFSKYRDQIQMALTAEGLRINLLESSETPLFKVGGTDLNDEAEALLAVIGDEVKGFHNSVVIEGHTDSRPFGAGSKMTNWELSTGRAHTARRVFESAGVPAERLLEVRGFADRQLLNRLEPEDSRNRRVSITLLSEEAMAERAKIPEETIIP